MGLDEFFLAAHSFGGYVCGCYAEKYPQHIKKLLLMSPIGYQVKPENFTWEKVKFRRDIGISDSLRSML